MLKRIPSLILILVVAVLIGLVGHGFELFMPVEGNNLIGWIKAFGFPAALECGGAIGLFVVSNHQTQGRSTRLVALLIGLVCLVSSVIIQYHYYRFRIDFDWLYSAILPGLVGMLSALAGLLDRDQAKSQTPATYEAGTGATDGADQPASATRAQTQPALVDVVVLVERVSTVLDRKMDDRFSEMSEELRKVFRDLPQMVRSEAVIALATFEHPQPAPVPQPDNTEPPQPAPQRAEPQLVSGLRMSRPQPQPSSAATEGEAEERDRQCYILRTESGLSYRQIGEQLEPPKSENTARGYVIAHARRHGLEVK